MAAFAVLTTKKRWLDPGWADHGTSPHTQPKGRLPTATDDQLPLINLLGTMIADSSVFITLTTGRRTGRRIRVAYEVAELDTFITSYAADSVDSRVRSDASPL